jgi:hypothetical protein
LANDPLASATTWRGSTPIDGVHQEAFYANLAGFDHMRAFVAAIGDRFRIGVSLATIARGGVEAFARAAWLMEPTSAKEMIARHAALALSDIKYIGKFTPTGSLFRWTGESVDPNKFARSINDTIRDLDLPTIEAPTATKLFSDFMHGLPGADGRTRYSQISSVAHGESFGITGFLDVKDPDDDSGQSVSLTLPRNSGIEYTMYLAVACSRVQNRIVERFSPPAGEIDRWRVSAERAQKQLRQLTASRVDESFRTTPRSPETPAT